MKKHCFRFILTCAGIVSTLMASGMNPDAEKIRQSFVGEAFGSSVNIQKVQSILEQFDERDSVWSGIDYADMSLTGYRASTHLANTAALARAYAKKGSPYYQDKSLKAKVDKALGYWLVHNFKAENWHSNQIVVPAFMVAIVYMLENELTPWQRERALTIAAQAHEKAWGARQSGDRVRILGLAARQALFVRDEAKFEHLMKLIAAEVRFAPTEGDSPYGRGIQRDYSFHHRTDRVNTTTTYGMGYMTELTRWAELVSGTRYRFPEEAIRLLVDYYLDGVSKQLTYGQKKDPGVYNREISTPSTQTSVWPETIPKKLMRMTDYRKDELNNLVLARTGKKFIVQPFAKFFWQTEHFAFQRPGFYTSVRMHSTRNKAMEAAHNQRGIKNHFRGDGANYLTLTGNEYSGTPPVYDWFKIPGTTEIQSGLIPPSNKINRKGITDFVGGVTDGLYGAAAFDFASSLDTLKARKSWFFFDHEYVCLGAGISAEADYPVATTLNQNRLNGPVTVSHEGRVAELPHGEHAWKDVVWVHHNNTGYIFPHGGSVHVSNQQEAGTWSSINKQKSVSKDTVRAEIFKLWIDHGITPVNASYAYVVLPGAHTRAVGQAAAQLPVDILSNTAALQAVKHASSGIAYAVFYEPGEVVIEKNLVLTAGEPCMVMLRWDKNGKVNSVTVSDPTRKLVKLPLSITRKIASNTMSARIVWDEKSKRSDLIIDLPQGVGTDAGKSVTVEMR